MFKNPYASLSDDVLNEYCKVFGDNVPSDEYKLIKAEVIGKENKFLKALYFGNTGRLTSYYLTVQNGKVYYITLVSKDTARQEQMDKVGDDIVCSIVLSSDTGYKRYVLSDPKMAIQFPSKYLVFWKNMSPNEDSLLVTGETVEY